MRIGRILTFLIGLLMVSSAIDGVAHNEHETSGKHALIIAIHDYDFAATGWMPISSMNDVPLIRNALLSLGVLEHNIAVVTGTQTTRNHIISEFNNLIDRVEEGDVVVIHISAHGQQVNDLDGDELDGYDEAIVPTDASIKLNYKGNGYDGSNHITDDEIEEKLSMIREKLGEDGHVLFIGDFCHSGSSTRSLGIARGCQFSLDGTATGDPLPKGDFFTKGIHSSGLASIVSLFASGAGEMNFETNDIDGKSVGALSYSVSRAMTGLNSNSTYRAFFQFVKRDMGLTSPNQNPQIEGDLSQTLMGRDATLKDIYFQVQNVDRSGNVAINCGWLQGIFVGSEVEFTVQATDATHNSRVIGRGTVISSELASSMVQMNAVIEEELLLNAFVFPQKMTLGRLTVTAAISAEVSNFIKQPAKNLLSSPILKIVDLEDNPELTISSPNESDIIVENRDQVIIYEAPINDLSMNVLNEQIYNYARALVFRNLNIQNPDFSASVELLPVSTRLNSTTGGVEVSGYLPLQSKCDINDNVSFRNGESFRIRLTNHSNIPLYASIVEIQPDGQINCIIPNINVGLSMYESKILAHAELELPVDRDQAWSVGPPFGREVLKLIMTRTPVDICDAINYPASTRRGSSTQSATVDHILSLLVIKKNQFRTRGQTTVIHPNWDDVYIETLFFDIIE